MSTRPQDIESAEKTNKAMQMRMAGFTYHQIGKALGFTKQRAHQIVTRELEAKNNETAETVSELRSLLNERYDSILARLWFKALPRPSADDKDPDLNTSYLDRILRIMEMVARLNGVDAPSQGDIDFGTISEGGSRFGLLLLRFLPEDKHNQFLEELEVYRKEEAKLLGVKSGEPKKIINNMPVIDSNSEFTEDEKK